MHSLMRGTWFSVRCRPIRDKAGWEKSRAASEHARRVDLSSLSSLRMRWITSGGRLPQRDGVALVWVLQECRSVYRGTREKD